MRIRTRPVYLIDPPGAWQTQELNYHQLIHIVAAVKACRDAEAKGATKSEWVTKDYEDAGYYVEGYVPFLNDSICMAFYFYTLPGDDLLAAIEIEADQVDGFISLITDILTRDFVVYRDSLVE